MWELVSKPSPTADITTMARAQDRAIGTMPPKTFYHSLEVPINTISTNKDFTQIVVAGRNVFKILDIQENGFSEKINLRVGRINLNFSITDVLWHHLDDHTIATAAGNGAVTLWDLNKSSKTKQECVFYDHKRTVNKICFHPTDASILMSGSQDGTINYFDIRKKGVAAKFFGRSDSIRDVQFNPFDRHLFAAACESGSIQLWDLRKPDHCWSQFTGHSGPVFTLDWHTEDRFCLGTGGRDKTIKVWNIQNKGNCLHSVPTIAEVASIRWRPREKYHIASCALVVDHHVSVWDIRRPYIPFAAFTEHTDVATGIIWHKESEILLSCSKDSTLYQHVFQDALRPAEHAPPVGLGVSCRGEICNACSNETEQAAEQKKHTSVRQSSQPVPAMPTFFKKAAFAEDDFKSVHSTMKLFNCPNTLNEHSLEALAKRFIFTGKTFVEICTHNAKVCHELGLPKKAQTWHILKFLFSEVKVEKENVATTSSKHASSSDTHNRSSGIESNEGNFDESSSESNDGEEGYPDVNKEDEIDLAVGADLDAIFQDDQFDGQFFAADNINDDLQEWTLPNEAFQPRHSIGEKSINVDHGYFTESTSNHPDHSLAIEKQKPDLMDSGFQFLGFSKFLGLPEWDFKPLVIDMLHHFAEQGDVQMSVTILLALQDKLGDEISDVVKEEWFLAYLELLNRLQLWGVSTKVIKLSNIPTVMILNQDSTAINTICGGCNKPMTSRRGWFCNRCSKSSASCSLCHLPVKGLYAFCQGCGHGGHLVHIQEWIMTNRRCPAGCGHRCEYS